MTTDLLNKIYFLTCIIIVYTRTLQTEPSCGIELMVNVKLFSWRSAPTSSSYSSSSKSSSSCTSGSSSPRPRIEPSRRSPLSSGNERWANSVHRPLDFELIYLTPLFPTPSVPNTQSLTLEHRKSISSPKIRLPLNPDPPAPDPPELLTPDPQYQTSTHSLSM